MYQRVTHQNDQLMFFIVLKSNVLFFFIVEDRKRPLKRFTPPRKAKGGDSETESGSDYSDSEYSGSSYT